MSSTARSLLWLRCCLVYTSRNSLYVGGFEETTCINCFLATAAEVTISALPYNLTLSLSGFTFPLKLICFCLPAQMNPTNKTGRTVHMCNSRPTCVIEGHLDEEMRRSSELYMTDGRCVDGWRQIQDENVGKSPGLVCRPGLHPDGKCKHYMTPAEAPATCSVSPVERDSFYFLHQPPPHTTLKKTKTECAEAEEVSDLMEELSSHLLPLCLWLLNGKSVCSHQTLPDMSCKGNKRNLIGPLTETSLISQFRLKSPVRMTVIRAGITGGDAKRCLFCSPPLGNRCGTDSAQLWPAWKTHQTSATCTL